jgi:serine O-acetyltransferase
MMNKKIFQAGFSKSQLNKYLLKQLNHFFPDEIAIENELNKVIDEALNRLEFSMLHVKLSSHRTFSHLHSDLYAQFIYFASNTAHKYQFNNLATKLFYLNKTLHSINCMYTTKLPKVFLLLHTVGTILGYANYEDFLVVNQGVTVGTNNEMYPTIKTKVMLRPHTSVIGNSTIGENCALSINATIFNETINDNKIIIGNSPNLIFKENKNNLIEEIFYLH